VAKRQLNNDELATQANDKKSGWNSFLNFNHFDLLSHQDTFISYSV